MRARRKLMTKRKMLRMAILNAKKEVEIIIQSTNRITSLIRRRKTQNKFEALDVEKAKVHEKDNANKEKSTKEMTTKEWVAENFEKEKSKDKVNNSDKKRAYSWSYS